MTVLIEILSWATIIGGGIFLIIGSVGIIRFPDFWSRLHAASVTDSLGMLLLMLGMCLQAGLTLVTVKLVVITIFLFITGPTATHAVANAALVSGFLPKGKTLPIEEKKTAGKILRRKLKSSSKVKR